MIPTLKAVASVFRASFSPPAMRLAAIACALMLPIIWWASLEQTKLDASLARRAEEATSIRWIATATGLASLARLPALESPAAEARVRLRLAKLRQYSAENARTIPAASLATTEIATAWNAFLRRRSGSALVNVANVTYRGLGTVSEDSQLSFETDPVLADLADSLDNAHFSFYESLMAAADVTRAGWRGGELRLDDRIAVAGLLSQSHGAKATLASDIGNAIEHRPALRAKLGATYEAAIDAAAALDRSVQAAVHSRMQAGDAGNLAAEQDRTAALAAALRAAFESESLARIGELQAETRRKQQSLLLQLVLAIAIECGAVFFAGRLLVRRFRSELERAKEQARMLSVELARQQAEHARMLTEAQFQAVFRRSQMGIALLSRSGATMECNPALSLNLGQSTPRIVPEDDARFAKLIAGFEATYQYEGPLARTDGTMRWAQITVSSIDVPQSELVAAIAIVQDITDRKAIDERLRFDAAHDELTLLPNRVQFLSRLDALIEKGADLGQYAVLFVDLDRFKLVNDTLGHTAGDRVLAIAARRLVAATRPGDIVARLHGDEFAVVVSDMRAGTPGEVVAERIKKTFLAPISVDGTAVVLTASVGIVPGLGGYRAAENVLRDADVAMYNAKKLGRSTAVLFDDAMHERLNDHMRMLTEIRFGIERREFRLVYQPIVDLRTGAISGVEALIRWHHPTLGIVSPDRFIPVAEETDAIEHLGRFALEETCAMLARMDAAGMREITASVNLSVPHLSNGDVVTDVRRALESNGIPASRLMLEITESALLENGTRASKVLDELGALGVRLCIDDFGTGYSSLRYLHEYPLDVLKIDRSFVYAQDGGIANEPIVAMLLTLARSLKLSAIAEGIETAAQRDALIAAGCQFAQGYLFSRPLNEPNLIRWIRAQPAVSEVRAILAS